MSVMNNHSVIYHLFLFSRDSSLMYDFQTLIWPKIDFKKREYPHYCTYFFRNDLSKRKVICQIIAPDSLSNLPYNFGVTQTLWALDWRRSVMQLHRNTEFHVAHNVATHNHKSYNTVIFIIAWCVLFFLDVITRCSVRYLHSSPFEQS